MFSFTVKNGDKEYLVYICPIKNCTKLDYYLDNIAELEKEMEASIVIVRKELAPFKRFLQIACTSALNRFLSKKSIAKKLSIEILLNIAGTRQIKDAIKRIVPVKELEALAIVISPKKRNPLEVAKRLRDVLECGETCYEFRVDKSLFNKVMEIYSISEEEIMCTYASDIFEALEKCLISRTAMLYITK